MGLSYHPSIVVGVVLKDLVTVTEEESTYEVHDKKGKKTGETATETEYTFSIKKGEQVLSYSSNERRIYIDELCDNFGFTDYPSVGNFGVFNTVYDGNSTLDEFIIGIKVLETDAMYDGRGETLASKLTQAIQSVTSTLRILYQCDAEIKVFIDGGIG